MLFITKKTKINLEKDGENMSKNNIKPTLSLLYLLESEAEYEFQ